ncbi:MAG: pre-rRNA-processing protein esf1 [Cirrosporium novae-zelandiae]|nr:MAG: pre-rRNA-processing protein esf1 [Cirrosporium novae-zelandiae]
MPKQPRQRQPKGSHVSSSKSSSITDSRFTNIETDPRFRIPSKRQTHVHLDKRFAHILKNEEFARKAKVDRYGRKLPKDAGRKQLERFYRIDPEDEEEKDVEEDNESLPEVENPEDIDDDDEVQKELARMERKRDPARDGGFSDSSSSEESSSDGEEDEEEEEEKDEFGLPEQRGELDGIPLGEVTSRIAVVNLDWDNIRAEDLMTVFSSFTPGSGKVLKVSIYPSEFGRERMAKEEVEGPPKEIFALSNNLKDENPKAEDENKSALDADLDTKTKSPLQPSTSEEEELNQKKLRQYQLDRLRYFYAVLTFSDSTAAKVVYDAVDGTEYLTTANFFDLRFIPDGTDFSEDKPRDECEKIPDKYKPSDFVTEALQHSKVKLTWDVDDKERKEVQARAFRGEVDDNDYHAFLASDDSASEEDDQEVTAEVVDATIATTTTTENENAVFSTLTPKQNPEEQELKKQNKLDKRAHLRALLGLPAESTHPSKKSKSVVPVGNMQVTFTSGLSMKPEKKSSVFENTPEEAEETAIERYMRKEKERKKARKERMKVKKSGHENSEEDTEEEKEDLGFDDPFFEAPDESQKMKDKKKQRKHRSKGNGSDKDAPDDGKEASAAELSLLLDPTDPNSSASHPDFNIRDLVRVEKEKSKSSKFKQHRSKTSKQNDAGVATETPMDVKDPRFNRLFERPEYAIDPTNPRFMKTEGMKKLLDEGRKRRHHDDGEVMDVDNGERKQKKKKRKGVR